MINPTAKSSDHVVHEPAPVSCCQKLRDLASRIAQTILDFIKWLCPCFFSRSETPIDPSRISSSSSSSSQQPAAGDLSTREIDPFADWDESCSSPPAANSKPNSPVHASNVVSPPVLSTPVSLPNAAGASTPVQCALSSSSSAAGVDAESPVVVATPKKQSDSESLSTLSSLEVVDSSAGPSGSENNATESDAESDVHVDPQNPFSALSGKQ